MRRKARARWRVNEAFFLQKEKARRLIIAPEGMKRVNFFFFFNYY
jgi:hypothetical protein